MRLLLFIRARAALVLLATPAIIGAQVVPVTGGTFAMGSQAGDRDETPSRTVTVSPFSIHSREVTEAQYDSCVTSGRCSPAHYGDGICRIWNGNRFIITHIAAKARDPRNPVVCVTWHQAQQYCRSIGLVLPTEAQWEYAARAGAEGAHPWGGENAVSQSVLSRTGGPQQVASYPPNGWGLYDMIGNVWEWVNDWYAPDAYNVDSAIDPAGSPAGLYRVIRGGGWYSNPAQATVANRQWFPPDFAEASIGFRCGSRH